MTEPWQQEIREARRKLGLSQRAVAAASHISLDSVRAYEAGRRHPTRQHLTDIIDALHVDRAWRNRVLHAAGFAPDGLDMRPSNIAEWWMTADEAAAETATYEWPAFVMSERAEVMSANAAAQAVWGVDLTREFLEPVERNLMSIASMPRFADRCLNWDEAVGTLRMFKTFHRAQEDVDNPTPYFGAVLAHFLKGDPKYVARMGELWQNAPDTYPYKMRWAYPIVWDQPGIGVLRFRCLISSASEVDGLGLHDWVPTDAESWSRLERLMGR